jgi:hypothetical protein
MSSSTSVTGPSARRPDDPWLTVKDMARLYPTILPVSRIRKLRSLERFPKENGRVGRLLVWNQSTIETRIATATANV